MALGRARGNAGDSWHTEPVHVSVEVQSQGGQGWYVARSGGGSGSHYICVDTLMVTSKGLIVGAGGDQG